MNERVSFINKEVYRKRMLQAIILSALLVGTTVFVGTYTFANPGAVSEAIIEPGTQVETASYVIWKEDSTYYTKNGMTGAIESGTNATQIINNALQNGDTVILRAGVYSLSGSILPLSNKQLIGEGNNTILRVTASINAIEVTDATGVYIAGFQIDGNSQGNHGVVLSRSHYSTVERLYIHSFTEYGIYPYETQNSTIQNNIIIGGTEGIALESIHQYSSYDTNFNNILNNYVLRQSGGTSQGSIHLEGWASYNRIIGNYIEGNTGTNGHGIVLLSNSSGLMYGNLIEANTIMNNAHSGIRVQHNQNTTIVGNTIEGNDYGISIYADSGFNKGGITITGNTIIKNNIRGISKDNGNTYYVSIVGNLIRGNNVDVYGLGSTDIIHSNLGYITENSGVNTVADGDWVAHGLSVTPTSVVASSSGAGRIVGIQGINTTHFQIYLINHNGTSYGTPEAVYWYAEYQP